MTICYKGNNFKYETEAVMKLFLPVQAFTYLFDQEAAEGDRCIISMNNSALSVYVYYNGREAEKACANDNSDAEYLLCRLLYDCMRELTGITPEWGFMTGIRPVKKVNALLEKGLDKGEIFRVLGEKYECSDRKLELAYRTAVTQSGYLSSAEKNSYSLFVSIPYCPSRCRYCSFVSHSINGASARKLLPEYIKKLCDEIERTARAAEELGLKLDTIYIGGGTPTVLSAEQLEAVMTAVEKNFDISKIREYTVEAGRPETISAEKLAIIKKCGATRISVNPQTMNDSVLEAVGRKHTVQDFLNAFKLAREMSFGNINADTIAGLPTDTLDSFKNTIDRLCGLEPESITVHALTIKRSADLFAEEERNIGGCVPEMVNYAQKKLLEGGYSPYYMYRQKNTIDNLENVGYAKNGFESLYNIYIMEETQTILAVGAGGSTKLVNPYNNRIERVINFKYPYEYISRYDEMLEKKKRIYDFYKDIL